MRTFKIFVSIFEISLDFLNVVTILITQVRKFCCKLLQMTILVTLKSNNSPEISLVVQHRSYWETATVRGFVWGCWSRCAFLPSDNQASQ